jgi:hypothetical protein
MNWAKQHVNEYTQAGLDKAELDFEGVDNREALLAAIDSGDWEAFTDEANKLGWTPSTFLEAEKTPEQLEAMKSASARRTYGEEMGTKGITDANLLNTLYSKGYTVQDRIMGLPEGVDVD